jgi:hypothetical protein
MIDAPNRIWADRYSGKSDAGFWQLQPLVRNINGYQGVEYTRADLAPTLEQLKRWEEAIDHSLKSDWLIYLQEIRALIAKMEETP